MVRKDDIRLLFFLSQKVRTIFSDLTMVDKPEGKKILVVAPHPDDDIIGCGGTLALHRQLGHAVSMLYLTNGEKGVRKLNATRSAEVRKNEAIRGADKINVAADQLYYLHLRDGDVINQSGTNYDLRDILEETDPDVIYIPSFLEQHRDHYAANVLLKNNLIKSVTIAAYEVWTPLVPNRLINITSTMESKREALMQHTSQLKELDYLDAVMGLNRYRAAMFKKEVQYAEAFIYCTSIQYFELMMSVE